METILPKTDMTPEHTALVARIDSAIKKNQSRQSFILLLQEISPALREQSEEIERLKRVLTLYADGTPGAGGHSEGNAAHRVLMAGVEAERDTLRDEAAALRKYAQHLYADCAKFTENEMGIDFDDDKPCTCGLAAVLADKQEPA